MRCSLAAIEIARAHGLEVRCGLHTGEIERSQDDIATDRGLDIYRSLGLATLNQLFAWKDRARSADSERPGTECSAPMEPEGPRRRSNPADTSGGDQVAMAAEASLTSDWSRELSGTSGKLIFFSKSLSVTLLQS